MTSVTNFFKSKINAQMASNEAEKPQSSVFTSNLPSIQDIQADFSDEPLYNQLDDISKLHVVLMAKLNAKFEKRTEILKLSHEELLSWAENTQEDLRYIMDYCAKVYEQFKIERDRTLTLEKTIEDLSHDSKNNENLAQEAHVTAQDSINYLNRINERVAVLEEERIVNNNDKSKVNQLDYKRLEELQEKIRLFEETTQKSLTSFNEALESHTILLENALEEDGKLSLRKKEPHPIQNEEESLAKSNEVNPDNTIQSYNQHPIIIQWKNLTLFPTFRELLDCNGDLNKLYNELVQLQGKTSKIFSTHQITINWKGSLLHPSPQDLRKCKGNMFNLVKNMQKQVPTLQQKRSRPENRRLFRERSPKTRFQSPEKPKFQSKKIKRDRSQSRDVEAYIKNKEFTDSKMLEILKNLATSIKASNKRIEKKVCRS